MCTVTFIPHENSVFITHSRDEKDSRLPAIPPEKYVVDGKAMLFPKDSKGGSWIALNEDGNAAVLLNGAFTKHEPLPNYSRSRGLVLLDIIAAQNLLTAFRAANFRDIEPFTVILLNFGKLFECRWDGKAKHVRPLDQQAGHIWASATLYDTAVLTKRKKWFNNWQTAHPSPIWNDVFNFHLYAGEGDPQNDLRMNRHNQVLTVSITGLAISPEGGEMKYLDLRSGLSHTQEINFLKSPAVTQ